MCRSAQDDLSGSCKKLIGVIFTTVMKSAVVFAVWNSSTAMAVGSNQRTMAGRRRRFNGERL